MPYNDKDPIEWSKAMVRLCIHKALDDAEKAGPGECATFGDKPNLPESVPVDLARVELRRMRTHGGVEIVQEGYHVIKARWRRSR